MSKLASSVVLLVAAALLPGCSPASDGHKPETETKGNPVVVLDTSEGVIKLELYPDKAPVSVENFLRYVDSGHYDGTIFHRVIDGFMIQGGGFTPEMVQKPTQPPIVNEASNGLKNDVGTVAMARTAVRDSATAQFFINLKDNDFLNQGPRSDGYAVFGKVIDGMDVVEKIGHTPTHTVKGMKDAPVTPVVIESARRE